MRIRKDRIWIIFLVATIIALCVDLYAMIFAHWPQTMISGIGITCFLLTGATILLYHWRW